MKLPNPIKSFLDRRSQEAAEIAVRKYVDSTINSQQLFNELNYSPETKEDYSLAFERSIWSYACVYAIASSAASVPLRLYTKGTDTEITTGQWYDLINYPNDDQGRYDFIESLISYMELTGDGFVELNDPVNPDGMKTIRSYWMEIQVNRDNTKTYLFKPDGIKRAELPEDLVIHFKYFHPNSELYGFSGIQAATNSIITDFYATNYTKKFFKDGGMINLYVKVKQTLQDFEFKRLKQEVKSTLTGIKNAHEMPVLDSDAEIKNSGQSVEAVLLKAQRDQCRDEILTAFGVPPIMLATLAGNETYNNADTQKKIFWEATMLPKLRKIEAQLNRRLFIKNNLEARFDLSGIAALKEDENKKATTATTLVKGGIITTNEARSIYYDMEPIEGGDTLVNPTATAPVAFQMIDRPVKKSFKNAVNFYLLKSAVEEFNTNFDKSVQKMVEAISPIFTKMKNKVLNSLPKDLNKIEKVDWINTIAASLDSETKTMMEELINRNTETMTETVASSLRRSSRSSRNIEQRTQTIVNNNKEHIEKWAEESADLIIKTNKEHLAHYLEKAVRENQEIDTVRKNIEQMFEGNAEQRFPRAQLIARTEANRTVNFSKVEAAIDSGFTHLQWITTMDGKERHTHAEANGQIIKIGDKFEVGGIEMAYPGDSSAPPEEVCNCRCSVLER